MKLQLASALQERRKETGQSLMRVLKDMARQYGCSASMLRKLRKELGLSQLDVANRIGTQRTYISHIENGHSDLEIQSLKRIVEVGLGLELDISIR